MRRLACALALAAGACVPTPAPPPRPAAAPAPPAAAMVPAAPVDWRDRALTPGTWSYRPGPEGSSAAFGRAGMPPDFVLRCLAVARRVALMRTGGPAGAMIVTTSYGAASWPAVADAGDAVATLAAADPALDRIAFSRGRFTVALPGTAELTLPAWAEPARVIEDCRG